MENIFQLNGRDYDVNELPPEGKQLLSLINEAQQELNRLNTQKMLLEAAQQQLISQLKTFIPPATTPKGIKSTDDILGDASLDIPNTPAPKPSEEPADFPKSIPQDIKAH